MDWATFYSDDSVRLFFRFIVELVGLLVHARRSAGVRTRSLYRWASAYDTQVGRVCFLIEYPERIS